MTVFELIEQLKKKKQALVVQCRDYEGNRGDVDSVEETDDLFKRGKVVMIDTE